MNGIVHLSERAAEKKVNFRLLRPAAANVAYDSNDLQVRVEAPPFRLHGDPENAVWSGWAGLHNWSVVFILTTPHGRLRCKQYLYDLGPLSALDHAALFDHRPQCMRAHALDDVRLAWTGYDYANARSLSMLAWGTNVELREIEGRHTNQFLVELGRSFEPVGPPKDAPFAKRSYWSRYPRYDLHMCRLEDYRPPSSLWRWRWPWVAANHRWQTLLPPLPLPGLIASGEQVFAPEWRFDSACVFGDEDRPDEVQLSFEPASGTGHARLWLRQSPVDRSPIDDPPQLDRFSGHDGFTRSELTSPSGVHIDVASHRRRYGPHDAIWRAGGYVYLLQVSAAMKHDVTHLAHLLTNLLGERVTSR